MTVKSFLRIFLFLFKWYSQCIRFKNMKIVLLIWIRKLRSMTQHFTRFLNIKRAPGGVVKFEVWIFSAERWVIFWNFWAIIRRRNFIVICTEFFRKKRFDPIQFDKKSKFIPKNPKSFTKAFYSFIDGNSWLKVYLRNFLSKNTCDIVKIVIIWGKITIFTWV